MTRASRKYFILVSQTKMNSGAGSRQDASPAAILADGEWQPVAAQAGAVGCITFVFFSNKKNRNSSYGSPEQNMEPKIFFFFLALSLRCAGGQKVHI